MDQITLEEMKEICGCETNNDLANMLSLYLTLAEEDANRRGFQTCGKLYRKRSNDIYAKLKELGYYDDLEEV